MQLLASAITALIVLTTRSLRCESQSELSASVFYLLVFWKKYHIQNTFSLFLKYYIYIYILFYILKNYHYCIVGRLLTCVTPLRHVVSNFRVHTMWGVPLLFAVRSVPMQQPMVPLVKHCYARCFLSINRTRRPSGIFFELHTCDLFMMS